MHFVPIKLNFHVLFVILMISRELFTNLAVVPHH